MLKSLLKDNFGDGFTVSAVTKTHAELAVALGDMISEADPAIAIRTWEQLFDNAITLCHDPVTGYSAVGHPSHEHYQSVVGCLPESDGDEEQPIWRFNCGMHGEAFEKAFLQSSMENNILAEVANMLVSAVVAYDSTDDNLYHIVKLIKF